MPSDIGRITFAPYYTLMADPQPREPSYHVEHPPTQVFTLTTMGEGIRDLQAALGLTEEAIAALTPPVAHLVRTGLFDVSDAKPDWAKLEFTGGSSRFAAVQEE